RPIIVQLDKATDQVMIESKFVEVSNSDVKNIGVNWSSLDHYSLGVGNISQTWDRSRGQDFSNGGNSNNSVNGSTSNGTTNDTTNGATASTTTGTTAGNAVTYVTGFSPVSFPTTVSLPNGSVTLPPSVPGSTTMAGKSPDFTAVNTYTGSNTNNISNTTDNSATGTVSSSQNSSTSNAISALTSLTNTGSTNRIASAVFSASDFNVVLSALKTLSQTRIVSNPTVVTLNNSEAFINVGEEYPIPSYTYNQERGSFEVSGFTYKPIGIILKVTPQVNARGFIKLTIEPTVSQRQGFASFGGAGGAEIPIIAERTAKTQVSMKDGFTMAIGGLMKTSIINGGTKVPVLGSIPLLGRLFSSSSKDKTVSNLIIFITAKTINAEGANIEEVFNSSQVRDLGIRRDELPGYRDKSDPFLPAEQPKSEQKN
ncbi:MAG: type II and III secretion system protein, partial [Opitutaceae bacterium]